MASARTGDALDIRKLRKKLRQIENLERKDRDLTNEELLKLSKKNKIRESLLELLATTTDDDGDNLTASTQSNESARLDLNNSTDNQSQKFDVSNIEVTMISPEDENDDSLIDVESVEENVKIEAAYVRKQDNGNDIAQNKVQGIGSETVMARQPIREGNKKISSSQPSTSSSKKEVPDHSPKKRKSETDTESSVKKTTTQFWRQAMFSVAELTGHSHLVTAAAMTGSTLVTASRDTTVKMWDVESLKEVRNFGGHTGTVTDVILLPKEDAERICELMGVKTEENLIISASTDCSFKIWAPSTGEVLKSTYTFNPVTKLVYHPVAEVIVTGSDAGKIEVWAISTGERVQSTVTFDSGVTGLAVEHSHLYACSAEGEIKVFEIRDKNLVCLFVSENIHAIDGGTLTIRCIRGFAVKNDMIYYGDDGINMKVLNWKTGVVHKLLNHSEDFGVTDGICFLDNICLSTAYSLDSGLGYINVRSHQQEAYIASLNDLDTERIISVCCSKLKNGSIAIATAGVQLKVWVKVDKHSNNEDEYIVKATYVPKLSGRAMDSDMESEAETDQSDEEQSGHGAGVRRSSKTSTQSQGGWRSWCILI